VCGRRTAFQLAPPPPPPACIHGGTPWRRYSESASGRRGAFVRGRPFSPPHPRPLRRKCVFPERSGLVSLVAARAGVLSAAVDHRGLDDPEPLLLGESRPSVDDHRQERIGIRGGRNCAGFCAALRADRRLARGKRGLFESCVAHSFDPHAGFLKSASFPSGSRRRSYWQPRPTARLSPQPSRCGMFTSVSRDRFVACQAGAQCGCAVCAGCADEARSIICAAEDPRLYR
jgi:hypothetical protein